jgi:hypothetical protein
MDYQKDNWSDKETRMQCVTCRQFVKKDRIAEGVRLVIGRCRKHAPTMNGWPVVFATDWYGDHKIDENKL